MWKLFQIAIIVAVLFSNICYDWAHGTGPLAVGVVALLAAMLGTAALTSVFELARSGKALLLSRQQGINNRRLTGR